MPTIDANMIAVLLLNREEPTAATEAAREDAEKRDACRDRPDYRRGRILL